MSAFPAQLKAIRQERHMKQREVAEHLGIRVRSYQAYEGGTREPDIDTLIALADFFGVTLDDLVGRNMERP